MKKKILTIASVCLVLMLAAIPLASCGEVEPTPTPEPGPEPTPGPGPVTPVPPTEEPQYGGTLRIGGWRSPRQIGLPALGFTADESIQVLTAIEGLIRFDATGMPIPWLATGWEVSTDPPSLTLTLRKGVKFHDGTDFNAEAAKWNLDEQKAALGSTVRTWESVEVIGDYTVRINLSRWENTVVATLALNDGLMISPTAYETYGEDWCLVNPVGTGPFKFVSWERDVGMKFERFDDYWQEGKPYLDRVEFVFIADVMVAMAALMVGEVDVLLEVEPLNVVELDATGNFKMQSCPSYFWGFVGDTAHPDSVFADVRVRRAVEYAIDKQEIIDALSYGLSEPVNQLASPGTWGLNPDVEGYPYNPEKAKQLLAEAGYPDGFSTKIYWASTPHAIVDMITAVQGYLGKVGIDAEVEFMLWGAISKMIVKGSWEDGLLLFRHFQAIPHDASYSLMIAFSQSSTLWEDALCPDDLENAIDKALSATDFETKQKWTWEAQRLFVDKYCLAHFFQRWKGFAVMYPEINDTGLYQVTSGQWTPEDAWIAWIEKE